MNLLSEPTLQHHQLSCCNFILQMRDLQFGLFIELNGVEISERVRREITEGAERPVHVLQHAFRIVGGDDAQVFLHFLVPDPRQVFRARPAFNEILLDFEPEHDVEIVGELIGLDSNQRRLYAIDGRVELFPVEGTQLMMKGLLQHGVKEAQNDRDRPTQFSHMRDWLS